MTERNLSIEIGGMSCDGCVNSVKRVLSRVPGVRVVGVSVGSAQVAEEGPEAPEQALRQAIEKAGFTPGAIEPR